MSGAEVLGLVTGVMTVICFAAQTAQVCKAVYDGQPSAEQDVARKSSSLIDAMITMKSHCQSFNPSTPDERSLSDIAHKCHEVATALRKEAALIEASEAKGNIFKAIRYSLKKSITGRSKIDKLEKILRDYETTMQTHLLVRLCSKSDAARLEQSQHFDNFSGRLKELITQLAADHSAVLNSVEVEARETREHTQKQLADTKTSIEHHVTKERQRIITEDQCERFLRSLKHQGMNERRTMVHQSHKRTFHWVFQRPRKEVPVEESRPGLGARVVDTDTDTDSDQDTYGPHFADGLPSLSDADSDDDSDAECASDTWPNLRAWLESEGTKYWISGKPGAGKSTLMKYLIESPKTADALDSWREGTEILSHFFWKLGGHSQQNLRGFWGSLAYQRLSRKRETLEYILSSFPDAKAKDEPSDWSDHDIRDVCLQALSKDRPSLCIFVDGLDEVADSDGAPMLLQAIDDIISTCQPNVKFCFSSRPEHRFKLRLKGTPEMKVHLRTEKDMRRFIQATLSKHFKLARSHQSKLLRWKITNALTKKANGVFIWLVLVLKSLQQGLENGDSESELLQRIEQIPGDIEKLYEAMWDRLGDNKAFYKTKGAGYLTLVAMDIRLRESGLRPYDRYFHFRPLSLRLGQIAIAIDPKLCERSLDAHSGLDLSTVIEASEKTRKEIETRCGGLLEIIHIDREKWRRAAEYEKGSHIVTFVHRTAYDHLTTTPHGSEILSAWSSSKPESYISLACGLIGLERLISRQPDAESYSYAIPWALMHLREAALNGGEPSTLSNILDTCSTFSESGIIRTPYLGFPSGVLTAFLLCILDFDCFQTWTLQALLKKGQDHGSLAEAVHMIVSRLYVWTQRNTYDTKMTEVGYDMGVTEYSTAYIAHYRHMLQRITVLGTSANIDCYQNGMGALQVRARLEAWLAICFIDVNDPTIDTWDWRLELLAAFINSNDDLITRTILRQCVFPQFYCWCDSVASKAVASGRGMMVEGAKASLFPLRTWDVEDLASMHLIFEVNFATIILHILRCVDKDRKSLAGNSLRKLCMPLQYQQPVLSYVAVYFITPEDDFFWYNYSCPDDNRVRDFIRVCQPRGQIDSVLSPFFPTNMDVDSTGSQNAEIKSELEKAIKCGALVHLERRIPEVLEEQGLSLADSVYQIEPHGVRTFRVVDADKVVKEKGRFYIDPCTSAGADAVFQ